MNSSLSLSLSLSMNNRDKTQQFYINDGARSRTRTLVGARAVSFYFAEGN